jgi:hypothetical protein
MVEKAKYLVSIICPLRTFPYFLSFPYTPSPRTSSGLYLYEHSLSHLIKILSVQSEMPTHFRHFKHFSFYKLVVYVQIDNCTPVLFEVLWGFLRYRSLNMARGGMEEKVGGSWIIFSLRWGGLENYMWNRGVFGFFPTKGLFLVIYTMNRQKRCIKCPLNWNTGY